MSLFNKIFQKSDSFDKKEFIEKANKLVSIANNFVVITKIKALQIFPQLNSASQIEHWDLFCTVTAAHAAILRTGCFVKNRNFIKKLDEIVYKNLEDYNPNGLGAIQDLEDFLINIYNSNSNNFTPELLEVSAGTWIVWNLTNKKPIKDEAKIASFLGRMFFTEFVNYYNLEFE